MERYAYIRVSTKEQNIDRQILALQPYEIPERNIYCDYQSGKDFERPAYQKLIKKLKAGDLLIVESIDRLGRNYNDILSEWQRITKEIRADILVLDMGLLDTRQKTGDLTGTLIADLVLQIFAYVAQTEREFICQRQAEGIAAAKRNGRKFGRPSLEMPEEFETICGQCERGELSTRRAAEMLHVSHTTFYRKYKKRMQESVSNSSRGETERQLSTCLRQMCESGRMKSDMSAQMPERQGGLRPSVLSWRPAQYLSVRNTLYKYQL